MRQRRADDAHMKLARERYVGGEQAAPAHQRRVLDARDGGADDTLLSGLFHRPHATDARRCALNPYDFGGAFGNVSRRRAPTRI
jgi:hypothetical protein